MFEEVQLALAEREKKRTELQVAEKRADDAVEKQTTGEATAEATTITGEPGKEAENPNVVDVRAHQGLMQIENKGESAGNDVRNNAALNNLRNSSGNTGPQYFQIRIYEVDPSLLI